jgi:hypothetical protein
LLEFRNAKMGDRWFYTPGDPIHTLAQLQDVYHMVRFLTNPAFLQL